MRVPPDPPAPSSVSLGEWDEEKARVLRMRSDRLRSLGEMAAGIAHELNQPLVGVRGIAEHLLIALERGWALPEERMKEKLSLLIDQAERMAHIIDHVRRFAREADSPDLRPTDLGQVVQGALRMLGEQLRARGIRIDVEIPSNLPLVRGNPFSLEEVVINALTNARDSLEERARREPEAPSPRIAVRAFREDDAEGAWIGLALEDNGAGLPEAVREHAFDPFFTTKDPDRGTGLGLSVSRSIVEQVGGTLDLCSLPEGGAALVVRLPAPASEERA